MELKGFDEVCLSSAKLKPVRLRRRCKRVERGQGKESSRLMTMELDRMQVE